jgi:hypothetical protein
MKMSDLLTITVKYKDHVKVLPYEGKNVWAIENQVGASITHNTDKDGVRVQVKKGTVKPYIDGQLAADGDIVGVGQTLEFAENPPAKQKKEEAA